MHETRLSSSAAAVLQAVANGYRYGFEIMDATGLPSGTVYPVLRHLELRGYVTSQWEHATTAHRALRPPRRYYHLMPHGNEKVSGPARRHWPRGHADTATPSAVPSSKE